jgi:dUTPase
MPPEGTYCQLLSCSGWWVKHNLEVKAGTIDHGLTGNVMVLLHNKGNQAYTVTQG